MLALVTYKFIYHCYGRSVLYRIRRGLLFYYFHTGFARAFELIIDNWPAFFLCPFIIIRRGCSPLREISCWIFKHYFINN